MNRETVHFTRTDTHDLPGPVKAAETAPRAGSCTSLKRLSSASSSFIDQSGFEVSSESIQGCLTLTS